MHDNENYCSYCGKEKIWTCSHCPRANLPPQAKYCPSCGKSRGDQVKKSPTIAPKIISKPHFTGGTYENVHKANSDPRLTDVCHCGVPITPGSGVCETCKL